MGHSEWSLCDRRHGFSSLADLEGLLLSDGSTQAVKDFIFETDEDFLRKAGPSHTPKKQMAAGGLVSNWERFSKSSERFKWSKQKHLILKALLRFLHAAMYMGIAVSGSLALVMCFSALSRTRRIG